MSSSKKHTSKYVAIVGLMVALAMIFSYVEFLIPFNFGVPGIKLGLANVVIIVALYIFGFKTALTITVLRVILNGIMFAGVFSVMYGLIGAIFSLVGMVLLMKSDQFSIIGISVFGAFLHVIGQLVTAALIFQNINVFIYLPVLTISSVITGILIGFIAINILRLKPVLTWSNSSFY